MARLGRRACVVPPPLFWPTHGSSCVSLATIATFFARVHRFHAASPGACGTSRSDCFPPNLGNLVATRSGLARAAPRRATLFTPGPTSSVPVKWKTFRSKRGSGSTAPAEMRRGTLKRARFEFRARLMCQSRPEPNRRCHPATFGGKYGQSLDTWTSGCKILDCARLNAILQAVSKLLLQIFICF